MRRIPWPAKLAYAAWMAVWIPVYWHHDGPQNFLWLCDVANFEVALALWLESSVLISAAAVGVLVIQLVWNVDFLGRLLLGFHPIGGTEYMFDATQPLYVRLFSLFHMAMPPVLLWAARRLGYDRRGLLAQTALTWIVLPATFLLAAPELNINWVWKPFDQPQSLLPPVGYLAFLLLAIPGLLYGPTHLLLRRILPPAPGVPAGAEPAPGAPCGEGPDASARSSA